MSTLCLIKENGHYVAIDKSDYLMHYGRPGMKRGMSIYQDDYEPIGEIAKGSEYKPTGNPVGRPKTSGNNISYREERELRRDERLDRIYNEKGLTRQNVDNKRSEMKSTIKKALKLTGAMALTYAAAGVALGLSKYVLGSVGAVKIGTIATGALMTGGAILQLAKGIAGSKAFINIAQAHRRTRLQDAHDRMEERRRSEVVKISRRPNEKAQYTQGGDKYVN